MSRRCANPQLQNMWPTSVTSNYSNFECPSHVVAQIHLEKLRREVEPRTPRRSRDLLNLRKIQEPKCRLSVSGGIMLNMTPSWHLKTPIVSTHYQIIIILMAFHAILEITQVKHLMIWSLPGWIMTVMTWPSWPGLSTTFTAKMGQLGHRRPSQRWGNMPRLKKPRRLLVLLQTYQLRHASSAVPMPSTRVWKGLICLDTFFLNKNPKLLQCFRGRNGMFKVFTFRFLCWERCKGPGR